MGQEFWFWAALPFLVACGTIAAVMFMRRRFLEGLPWIIGVLALSAVVLDGRISREAQVGLFVGTMAVGAWYRKGTARSRRLAGDS